MSRLIPDPTDRERFVTLLILGEILTKRDETGPLARVWRPVGPRKGHPPKKKSPEMPDTE